ncbi:PaaI family thioesterase [Mycobacterium sp. 94-17]|uniref:PaaI family thioesterase n=1 Tax=Mycobacterium sp. 94-17 TaxID=2986147 RepID=UPI002D1EFC4C|nr:PaaI family thioesterase [Mycobacterium sp. 94-17]MEB4209722.1 PaaI family thioesterase [Mycobacterium sp. 94-17]
MPDNDCLQPDWEAVEPAYASMADAARRLIDAIVWTEVDAATAATVTDALDSATARLRAHTMPQTFGLRRTLDGELVAWTNAVIGERNPIAPPIVIRSGADSRVWADVELGAAYEGSTGLVHGGVCALILDHLLGSAARQSGQPAVTGTLTVRYVRPTRLGMLHAEAHVDRIDGAKMFVVGLISDRDNATTVQADGVFVIPKSATAAQ